MTKMKELRLEDIQDKALNQQGSNSKIKKAQPKNISNTYKAVCRFLNTKDDATPHYYLGYN